MPKKTGRLDKAKVIIPDAQNPMYWNSCKERAMCQGLVPTPLYKAARKQLKTDKISMRRLLRWALMEYLRLRNPKKAQDAWNQCI